MHEILELWKQEVLKVLTEEDIQKVQDTVSHGKLEMDMKTLKVIAKVQLLKRLRRMVSF